MTPTIATPTPMATGSHSPGVDSACPAATTGLPASLRASSREATCETPARTERSVRPFAHRRKPQLGDVGTDPDYRFTLANERTRS